MLLTRAYHEDRGDARDIVLTPDTAHGTNPATVTHGRLSGGWRRYERRRRRRSRRSAREGTDRVACLMLTNPNTLGLFDPNITEIARIVHDVGATLYYDGANLNAIMGISRPGDMGFDIVHFNLHKSFTQPHGGGGPGAGPIAVSDRIAPYLPVPIVDRSETAAGPVFDLVDDLPQSIGRLRGFQGTTACLYVPTPISVRSVARACGRRPRPRCSTRTTSGRSCAPRGSASTSGPPLTATACMSSWCPAVR